MAKQGATMALNDIEQRQIGSGSIETRYNNGNLKSLSDRAVEKHLKCTLGKIHKKNI